MEWYLREYSDGFIVPSHKEACDDQYMEDVLPTQYDWCQWNATESAENPERQDSYRGESSSCGQPVFKLQNGTETMDDIFLDSFLEEDQLCPDSVYAALSFEDILSNVLVDDSSGKESEMCAETCSFLLRVDDFSKYQNMEDNSSLCSSYESQRFISCPVENKTTVKLQENKATVSAPRIVSANLDEVKSSESMILLELEGVMLQMNEKTRICFRDAMYRLAKSFEQKHSIYGSKNATQVNCENSRVESSRSAETATNIIDRAIANLMFSEQQYCGLPELRIS